MNAKKRIEKLVDVYSFKETNAYLAFRKPIDFPEYEEKHKKAQEQTQLNEAVVTGLASIEGRKIAIGVMESGFIMGSMGSVLGEKVAQLFELGIKERCPALIFTIRPHQEEQKGEKTS